MKKGWMKAMEATEARKATGAMENQMENLIPLVAKLADRYTSMDSSSVSYETARMLMEAVIYCIREWEGQGGDLPAAGDGKTGIDWEPAYLAGYERVLERSVRQKGFMRS